ncbi:1-acyl-sn-glycerol-3-phosphate acyltransferase [Dactylosporangium vinaceum]|uniref:Lysophospholipid acyltransferase family protein n=1 Tax=Dactylosporangium vinaceum TaxID=53362 RepID=A0ABV5M680_9ACTN|nr:lysophospholipid acyltransferase family protein [Dactylosporangium vinaceum]UAB97785.1 1-acyl-sn-glycerol-3-phosphate acyltransferase [Dactylosporangium vinaceum]
MTVTATPMRVLDSLWLPRSTCGAECLAGAAARPVSSLLMAKRVLVTGFVLLLAGLAVPVLAVLPQRQLIKAQRILARAVLAGLGVKHAAAGKIPQSGALLVANHVSWLDVIVILAHAPARLLAKREVRAWPLIGRLAATLGTVFVDRSRPKSLPATIGEVRRNLAAGGVVAVFPEGTTWCGRMGGTFRPAMFQAAVDAGVPVVPVRLTFAQHGAVSTVAAFIGDESLAVSLRRVLAARDLSVGLRAHPKIHPAPCDGPTSPRRVLAKAAAAVVAPAA